MAARIRLKKISHTAKKRYNYRIVVLDRARPRDTRVIEEIGHYDPAKKPAVILIKCERYEYWIKQGAEPSDTVASLYKRFVKSQAR